MLKEARLVNFLRLI